MVLAAGEHETAIAGSRVSVDCGDNLWRITSESSPHGLNGSDQGPSSQPLDKPRTPLLWRLDQPTAEPATMALSIAITASYEWIGAVERLRMSSTRNSAFSPRAVASRRARLIDEGDRSDASTVKPSIAKPIA